MQQDSKHVPDWLLERLALGELDAETAADVRRRLAAEGRTADEIAALVATSNREILEELPATSTAAAIRRRAERTAAAARPARKRTALFALPIALAGGLALTHMVLRQHTGEGVVSRVGENPEIILSKRNPEPRLYVYRHRSVGNQRLKDGSTAARGDLLQLAYGGDGYGVVFSIDGARKVTLHWPEGNAASAPAIKDGENRVPSSYELDDAPAFERFFLVQAKTPFSVATALEAARALAAQPTARKQSLALPPGFEQISLALEKAPAGTKELP